MRAGKAPDEELKALILNFIMRKGRLGEHYFPIDTMSNWLGQVVKNNGKNVRKKVRVGSGWISYSSQREHDRVAEPAGKAVDNGIHRQISEGMSSALK